MYVFRPDKKHVQIVVRGKGVLTAKTIHTDAGQSLAAFIVANMQAQAHNLMEVEGRATKAESKAFSPIIPVDLSKKKATSLTSQPPQTDGESLKLSEQKQESALSESRESQQKKGRPKGSKNRKWDVSEATEKPLNSQDVES